MSSISVALRTSSSLQSRSSRLAGGNGSSCLRLWPQGDHRTPIGRDQDSGYRPVPHQSELHFPWRPVAPLTIASISPWAEAVTPLVVIILGPTASGKTALSLALAERFNGEIVSCDSVAVYRGMELGTAKPSKEERARVPHHLIDVADPDEPFTAGEYSKLARESLQEIAARKRLPIVTGGTGLYLRALTEGLFAGPARQEDLRARLRSKAQKHGGAAWLHRV